jgi:phage-related protein
MDEIIRIEENINLIHTFIKLIKKEVRKMSAVGDAIQTFVNQIDAGLEEIIVDIQALKDLIAAGGTVEEVSAKLQPLLDKVNAIKSAQ